MTTNTAESSTPEDQGILEHLKYGDPETEIFSAEDIANSVSHGIGLGMSITGLALIVVVAAIHGGPTHIISAVVYGLSLTILFGASTIYHSMTNPGWRRFFRIVDHSAIYLLIAGSYTPLTLVILPDPWGWWIFGIVWALAMVGVIYKVFWFERFPGLSLALYLGMGWTILIAIKPLWESMEIGGLVLLFAGGFFYTAGVIFFSWEKLFFNHAIWHLFVMAAAVCHYMAMLFYVFM